MTFSTEFLVFLAAMAILISIEVVKHHLEKRSKKKSLRESKKLLQNEIKRIYAILGEEVKEPKGETTGGDSMEETVDYKTAFDIKNTKAISELLEVHAEEKDYELATKMITDYVQDLYRNFEFKLMKPQEGDYLSGYALTFDIDHSTEKSRTFLSNLFKLAVDRGLAERQISNHFSDAVKEGKVVELGDIELDEVRTGLSSILSGEPLTIFISYETAEYKEKRLEQEAKQKEEEAEQKAKKEQFEELRVESHKALTAASIILKEMSDEIVKEHPEYLDAYNRVQELYK